MTEPDPRAPAVPAEPPVPAPAAPYRPPQDPRFAQLIEAPVRRPSPLPGLLALALGMLATVGAALALAMALPPIGAQVARARPTASSLAWLTPVRDQVLVAELAVWVGAALWLTALVLGIVAVVRRAGRAAGIAAIVLAVLGPAIAGGIGLIAFVVGAAG